MKKIHRGGLTRFRPVCHLFPELLNLVQQNLYLLLLVAQSDQNAVRFVVLDKIPFFSFSVVNSASDSGNFQLVSSASLKSSESRATKFCLDTFASWSRLLQLIRK